MRQMRNIRTGKIAVYDADLVESGRWELYAPKEQASSAKPFDQEFLNASDEVSITVTRSDGESIQHQTRERKARLSRP